MVVACRGYGNAEQILIFVHGGYHSRKEEQKSRVVFGVVGRVEQVFAAVGRHRPVIVLAASVNSVEGLFVEEANHSVAVRDGFHNGHYDLVVVHGVVRRRINAGEFVLSGSDFVMLRLRVNAEFPEFLVEIAHIIPDSLFDFSEVMVFEFLSFGRVRSEKRSAAGREVESVFVNFLIDEEVFLFRADGGYNSFGFVISENSHNAQNLFVERFDTF